MRTLFAGGVLFLSIVSGSARGEAACAPLTLITSVDMRIGDDGRVYVPAKIGDAQKSMLVDTGGFLTEITQAAVAELNLDTHHTGLELIGVAGDTTDVVARAPFTIGNLHAKSMDFMVMPSFHQFADDVSDAAGVLAPDHLRPYDADFDFSGKKFNLLSQDHCEGKVVYWPADTVAVVPIAINSNWHILVPVTVDGHKFTAMLDTGATNTVFNLETARSAFSLQPGDSATPAQGGLLGSPNSKTYTHRFSSLSLEGIAVANPVIELIPDLMRNKTMDPKDSVEHGTHLQDPNRETGFGDMILGMDILHHLHLYIAYKEKTLYITPASAPAPAAQAGPAAATTR